MAIVQIWRNSFHAKHEPVRFTDGWVLGERWRDSEWRNNPHAIIETRTVDDDRCAYSIPIRGGDVFFHPRIPLDAVDPKAVFYSVETGEIVKREDLGAFYGEDHAGRS